MRWKMGAEVVLNGLAALQERRSGLEGWISLATGKKRE
jgi:hypothetical protein